MQRRQFLQTAIMSLGAAGLAACETSTTPQERVNARREIDAGISPTLDRLYSEVPGSRDAAGRAAGILVFPSVVKAGVGIGGEYGRGALRVGGQTVGYYELGGGSLGLTLGADRRSVVAMFMTPAELERFRAGPGWTFGANASYATPQRGVANRATIAPEPVVVYVFGNTGLMVDASLEGARVTRLDLA